MLVKLLLNLTAIITIYTAMEMSTYVVIQFLDHPCDATNCGTFLSIHLTPSPIYLQWSGVVQ